MAAHPLSKHLGGRGRIYRVSSRRAKDSHGYTEETLSKRKENWVPYVAAFQRAHLAKEFMGLLTHSSLRKTKDTDPFCKCRFWRKLVTQESLG